MNYIQKLLKGFEYLCIQSTDIGKFYYTVTLLTSSSDLIQHIEVNLYDLVNTKKSKVNDITIDTSIREITYLKYLNNIHARVPLDIQPYESIAGYLFSNEGIKTMFQHYRFTYDPNIPHFLNDKSVRLFIGIDESYEDNDLIGG